MPTPILHSKLTQTLDNMVTSGTITSRTMRNLVSLTSNGVNPEGGPLPPTGLAQQTQDKMAAPDAAHPGDVSAIGRVSGSASNGEGNGFRFSTSSQNNLLMVKRELCDMAALALIKTTQDFAITDGLRTPAEQAINVAKGVSRTQHSMHLPQPPDGFAWAIDATPVVGGRPCWDWNLIYPVAAAMHEAATKLGFAQHIRWGGAWDRRLSDFGDTPESFQDGMKAYAIRHTGSDLLDGPHYEWCV